MADWTTIADTQVDPDAPVTSELGYAWRDNPIAIAEGASGAPRITQSAFMAPVAGTGFAMGPSASVTTTTTSGTLTAKARMLPVVSGTLRAVVGASGSGGANVSLIHNGTVQTWSSPTGTNIVASFAYTAGHDVMISVTQPTSGAFTASIQLTSSTDAVRSINV